MLSRRLFANCALCAATALIAADPEARAQAPAGLARTVLNQTNSGPNEAVIQMTVAIQPGFFVARHTHPGIETSAILAGGGTLMVRGQPDRVLKPGDAFQVPREVPHALKNGDALTQVLAVYTVDKDKPLATAAPE